MFQFERGQNFPFDWPTSVSNILTVRWWSEPKIVGRNFASRIQHPLIREGRLEQCWRYTHLHGNALVHSSLSFSPSFTSSIHVSRICRRFGDLFQTSL